MKRLFGKLLTFIGFGPSVCSAWRAIDDARPEIGDPIYWAGHVVEKAGPLDIMLTAEDEKEPFVITPDTLWLKIPEPTPEIADA